mmetsp:Transcript_5292/g.8732  ORF Transcript_5292/g.8732 Transcript_5292/m.8732 type:complete len:160 (-) Transcript_5292:427-906(-)
MEAFVAVSVINLSRSGTGTSVATLCSGAISRKSITCQRTFSLRSSFTPRLKFICVPVSKTSSSARLAVEVFASSEKDPVSKEQFFAAIAKEEGEYDDVVTLVCKVCANQGVVPCKQCEGGGVNLSDHFGGKFKTGEQCWLCRGLKMHACSDCTASLGDS